MNICMLTTSFPKYEGDIAGKFVFELAKELSKNNTISIVAPMDSNSRKYELMGNIKVHRFSYMLPKRWQKIAYREGIIPNLKNNPIMLLILPLFILFFVMKSIVISRNCDVIHSHWVPSGLIGLICRFFNKTPLLITTRGTDINGLTAGFLKFITIKILKKTNKITTVSNVLKTILIDLGIDKKKIRVIPNGVSKELILHEDEKILKTNIGLPLNKSIILYIGRLTPVKGPDYLIEAIKIICRKEKNCLFVFIGKGQLLDTLLIKIKDYHINNYVVFVGEKKQTEIAKWLNVCDIIVIPSLSEGRPNVALEAMICQKPVVATNVGGISELVINGKTGFLVPEKNPKEMAEKLLILINNKILGESMGRQGKKYLNNMELTWEKCAEKTMAVYSEIFIVRP